MWQPMQVGFFSQKCSFLAGLFFEKNRVIGMTLVWRRRNQRCCRWRRRRRRCRREKP